jgi:ribonuclease P protein component
LRFLECVWMDNTAGHARMGLIVPRFHSTAVARNRLRRRLTELWRRELQQRQGSRDLLIRARKTAYAASFAELQTDLLAWVGSL